MVNRYKIYNMAYALIAVMLVIALSACDHDAPGFLQNEDQNGQEWHTAVLNFQPILSGDGTRASGQEELYEPCSDDMLMIDFVTTSGKSVMGYAKYNMDDRQWQLTYAGDLPECSNVGCKVIYIGNNPVFNESNKTVSFTSHSPLFSSKVATYDRANNGTVSLYATLSPMTSRVRFRGSRESSFEVKGLGSYNGFTLSDWVMDWVEDRDALPSHLSASDEGYLSPYHYVVADRYAGFRHLWIKEGNNVYLWKKNTLDYLHNGASGMINLPSVDADGWLSDTYRTKSVADIAIRYQSDSGWTQTESQTKFYSGVGIQVDLKCTITSKQSQTFTDYPLEISIQAYDENGDFLDSFDDSIHKDDIVVNESFNFRESFYVEGASYYTMKFYGINITGNITDFVISTF